MSQKDALQLRSTGSVQQPMSWCDLLNNFEAVDLVLHLKACGTRSNVVDRLG